MDEAAKTYQEILKADPKTLPVLSALGVVLGRHVPRERGWGYFDSKKDGKTAQRRRRGVYWLVAGKAKWKSWLNLFIA